MDLSKKEVANLVSSYDDPQTTGALYEFGATLTLDIQEQANAIDSKAITVLGWATGILAFLFAEASGFSTHFQQTCLCIAAFSSLLAVGFSFAAMRSRGAWARPSDTDWIQESFLVSADILKRWYVRSLHDNKSQNFAITKAKSRLLFCGELFLMIGAVSLGMGTVAHFLGHVFRIITERFF